MRFGLWFSNLCVKTGGDDDDSSSDSDEWMEDDDDGKRRHKKCHCTKMASDCFFETYDMFGPSSFVEVQSYPTADRKGKSRLTLRYTSSKLYTAHRSVNIESNLSQLHNIESRLTPF